MAVKKVADTPAPGLSSAPKKATTKAKPKTATGSAPALSAAQKGKLVTGVFTSPKALDELGIAQTFPVEALEEIPSPGRHGTVFRLDGGFLDGLRMQARRVQTSDGKKELWLSFKIAGPSRADFQERLEKKGAQEQTFSFQEAEAKKVGSDVVLKLAGKKQDLTSYYSTHVAPHTSSSNADKALVLTEGASTLEYIPTSGPAALRGYVRIRLSGSNAAAQKDLKKLIDKVGLQPAFAPTTEVSLRRYALMKLLWHVDPSRAAALAEKGPLSDLKVEAVQKELKSAGVSEERMKSLRYEEVAPGHFTVMDPVGLEDMKKAGLRYAYSTVTDPEHVLSILRYGQKATITRWEEGLLVSGMSSMADVGSGGAQGVFSRLVTKSAKNNSWAGRTYKIILKPEQMSRLDVWGWEGDYFGRSWNLEKKNFGAALVKSVGGNGSSYQSYNEIISPVGNGPDFIACVVATNSSNRDTLINFLKKQKYQPPGDQSLEDFVRLASSIDIDLLA